MARQYPELPFGLEMIGPAVAYASGRVSYTSEQMVSGLASHYRLGSEDLSLRLHRSGRPAFHNYVDHLLSLWTRHGVHVAVREGVYQPTELLGTLRGFIAEGAMHEVHSLFLRSRRNDGDPRTARDAGRKPLEERQGVPEIYRKGRTDSPRTLAVPPDPVPEAERPVARPSFLRPTAPPLPPGVLTDGGGDMPIVSRTVLPEAERAGRTGHARGNQAGGDTADDAPVPERAHHTAADVVPTLRLLVRLSHDIAALRNLTPTMMAALDAAGVVAPADLADLSPEGLRAIVGREALDFKGAYGTVMSARSYWLSDAIRGGRP